jgi:DNA polymerase I-like protein with 3'-5' exonuclease and polymerase domains
MPRVPLAAAIECALHDTSIAAWLLSPERPLSFDDVVNTWGGDAPSDVRPTADNAVVRDLLAIGTLSRKLRGLLEVYNKAIERPCMGLDEALLQVTHRHGACCRHTNTRVACCRRPHVRVVAHPQGRGLLPAYKQEMRVPAVLAAMEAAGVAVDKARLTRFAQHLTVCQGLGGGGEWRAAL